MAEPATTPFEDARRSLRAVAPGAGRPYEDAVEKALRLIFGGVLSDFRPQRRSRDGLEQRDLIAVLRQSTTGEPLPDFWETLQRHLNVRYVLFEMKNYNRTETSLTEPAADLPPTVLHTSERYLLPWALRPVGFVIAPCRPHPRTVDTAHAIAHESKKFFFFLSDLELVQMLDAVEEGSGLVDAILLEKMHDFFMEMAR